MRDRFMALNPTRLTGVARFDGDVVFSVLNRLWLAFSGLALIFLTGFFTTPNIQGVYYTFNSLIYMQVFVEMGLGIALVQLIGHEMATLTRTDDGRITGNEAAKQRLHSLIRFGGMWFMLGSALLFVVLAVAGVAFFTAFGSAQLTPDELSGVLIAWGIVVLGVSFNLNVNAALFVVEGSGQVAAAARIRLLQGVVGTLLAAATLAVGGGVFALSVQMLAMPVVGSVLLARRHGVMLHDLWRFASDLPGLDWRRDILPFQSRIAISWLSGFFTLQIFSPLLFAMTGAATAGRMGMSLQIFTALNSLFIVLVTARAPLFTRLIALDQRAELKQRFRTASAQSLALLLAALLVLVPLLILAAHWSPRVVERVLPWPYMLPLALSCIGNHILFAQAAFLRAHRREPFMALSVASGLLTSLSAVVLVAGFGVLGAVIAYSVVTLAFTLPIGTRIFVRYWTMNA